MRQLACQSQRARALRSANLCLPRMLPQQPVVDSLAQLRHRAHSLQVTAQGKSTPTVMADLTLAQSRWKNQGMLLALLPALLVVALLHLPQSGLNRSELTALQATAVGALGVIAPRNSYAVCPTRSKMQSASSRWTRAREIASSERSTSTRRLKRSADPAPNQVRPQVLQSARVSRTSL